LLDGSPVDLDIMATPPHDPPLRGTPRDNTHTHARTRGSDIFGEERVDLVRHRLVAFARTLSLEDEVVIEATGNSAAVERVIRP
jgi:hypothetical protein